MRRALLICGLLLPCGIALAQQAPAEDPVAATIERARPRAEEERWRLIPFGDSLVAALETARAQHKPVFFFGYDGILDCGYC